MVDLGLTPGSLAVTSPVKGANSVPWLLVTETQNESGFNEAEVDFLLCSMPPCSVISPLVLRNAAPAPTIMDQQASRREKGRKRGLAFKGMAWKVYISLHSHPFGQNLVM